MIFKNYGKHGYADDQRGNVITFEVLAAEDAATIEDEKEKYNLLHKVGNHFSWNKYTIASRGIDNNLPTELATFIKYNHLLPEIIKKQVKMHWGQGPFVYTEEYTDDPNLQSKRVRKPVNKLYPEILAWINNWHRLGINSFSNYAKQSLFSYYYSEEIWNKWRFNKSRRIGGLMPVMGLERVRPSEARLAMEGTLTANQKLTDNMLTHVVLNDWEKPYSYQSEVFPRFDYANPLKHAVAINYVADKGFDDDIYSNPTYFYGLRPWIKASNLNPEYINSYLVNSLNAKLHVIIPDAWIKLKETTLRTICSQNAEYAQSNETDKITTTYDGLTGIGTVFSYAMIDDLVKIKLKQVTEVLSGSGKNQGKTFWSRSFQTINGLEKWTFEEIPVKYKEFIDSIIGLDKRAVQVILEGKGVPPSISNVTNEGVFQNSGSELYYNILIYLNSLFYAEDFICHDINEAIRINFPRAYEQGARLGFYRNVPERQQEINPKDRMDNATTK